MSTRRRPPGIPEPAMDPQSMLATIRALKEQVEILSGARGESLDSALRRSDMVALGLASEADLQKIERYRLQTG